MSGPDEREESPEITEAERIQQANAAAADPILDRLPQQRGKRATKGVIRILDELNREDGRP